MGESYEVNLLSNVHAVENKTSVSKELGGHKRRRAAEIRKKKGNRSVSDSGVVRVAGRASYLNDATVNEQESTIDITV